MKIMILMLFLALPLTAADVVNGVTPKGKAKTIVFTEELRLGPESGEEYHEWNGTKVNLVVNKKGEIYVMDPYACRIIKFDENGKFVKQAGQKGEGPKEYQFPTNISLLDNGNLFIFENRFGQGVTTTLNGDLEVVERAVLPRKGHFYQSMAMTPSGKHVSAFWLKFGTPGKMSVQLGLLDMEQNLVNLITDDTLFPFDPNKVADSNWWIDYMAQWFALATRQGVVIYDEDGSVYTAEVGKYEITRHSPDLKEKFVFSREYKPKVQSDQDIIDMAEPIKEEVLATMRRDMSSIITDTVISKAIEKADFPQRKQPIFGILPTKDHVLVIHDYELKTQTTTVDIFDKKGVFVGSGVLPKVDYNYYGSYFGLYSKITFRGDKAYAMITDEDDELSLVRYGYEIK